VWEFFVFARIEDCMLEGKWFYLMLHIEEYQKKSSKEMLNFASKLEKNR
jgi:hypothetical protein